MLFASFNALAFYVVTTGASPYIISDDRARSLDITPVLATTCVDKKVKGTKIQYIRGTVDADGDTNFPDKDGAKDMVRRNKKCQHLAKESTKTIVKACELGKLKRNGVLHNDPGGIADYCKGTCDNCDITIIIPECDDNDVNPWKYEGEAVTCKHLRSMDKLVQAHICDVKNGAKVNCISTCNLCP